MKRRLFYMLLMGLALAFVIIVAIEIASLLRPKTPDADKTPPQNAEVIDINRSIDPPVFRSIVESGGILRLSGTSEPDGALTLIGNGDAIQTVQADRNGTWDAELLVAGADNLAIDMVLRTVDGGQIWSDETVLRIPPSVTAASPGAPDEAIPLMDRALIIVTAPGGPTRIVQNPYPSDVTAGGLSMGPIDYDDSGGVIFSGRSTIPGRVRIYGDGAVIGETQISNAGRWFFIAADTLPEGPYDIAAELTTSNGVLSRIDLTLDRLNPDVGEVAPADEPFAVISPDVWQIRRTLAGGGAQYTAIFNPDIAE